MKEVKGKYGTAKIFTDLVEDSAVDQVKTLMNQEFVDGCKVRMMPDIHSGSGCVIGTTMEIKDKICPQIVGVDIGCGMHTTMLPSTIFPDFEKLDQVIHEHVPSGFNIRKEPHHYIRNAHLDELLCRDSVDIERAKLSLGTLGGGNHFIEVDRDDEGRYYLVIHTGSRHLGVEVAEYYQNWAYDSLKQKHKNRRNYIIESLRAQGREREIQKELANLPRDITKDLAYVSGMLFDSYLHDMKIVQEYAKWNRIVIADDIRTFMNWGIKDDFETIHNYIDTDQMILRKGAVSAKKGEMLLIPMNMRDGSLLCRGKGNPDWNYSAPHGAGRIMSRIEAFKSLDIHEFEREMHGVYSTSVCEETIDESPMAYKPMESIVENIGDTVDILKVMKPVYNFKAGKVNTPNKHIL